MFHVGTSSWYKIPYAKNGLIMSKQAINFISKVRHLDMMRTRPVLRKYFKFVSSRSNLYIPKNSADLASSSIVSAAITVCLSNVVFWGLTLKWIFLVFILFILKFIFEKYIMKELRLIGYFISNCSNTVDLIPRAESVTYWINLSFLHDVLVSLTWIKNSIRPIIDLHVRY